MGVLEGGMMGWEGGREVESQQVSRCGVGTPVPLWGGH